VGGAADRDLARLPEPRIFLLAADVELAPLGLEILGLDRDVGILLDCVALAPPVLDLAGQLRQAFGVGGLSGTILRSEIDLRQDRIADPADDVWNRRMLDLLAAGDVKAVLEARPAYAREAKVDMGFKHFSFVLGALGGTWQPAIVHGYGPVYGGGAAVVELRPRS